MAERTGERAAQAAWSDVLEAVDRFVHAKRWAPAFRVTEIRVTLAPVRGPDLVERGPECVVELTGGKPGEDSHGIRRWSS